MSDYARDFQRLMREGYNIYIESDDDGGNILLEAHHPVDDDKFVRASYNAMGKRLTYKKWDMISQIRELLTIVK